MSGGSSQGSTSNPLSAGIGGAAASQAQTPQWLKGLQIGTQMAQLGQGRPMQSQAPMQRPMMGGPAPGMVSGAVPGGQPQMPMGGGMMAPPTGANGGMGMPQGGQPGGINPAVLQMLMRSR